MLLVKLKLREIDVPLAPLRCFFMLLAHWSTAWSWGTGTKKLWSLMRPALWCRKNPKRRLSDFVRRTRSGSNSKQNSVAVQMITCHFKPSSIRILSLFCLVFVFFLNYFLRILEWYCELSLQAEHVKVSQDMLRCPWCPSQMSGFPRIVPLKARGLEILDEAGRAIEGNFHIIFPYISFWHVEISVVHGTWN